MPPTPQQQQPNNNPDFEDHNNIISTATAKASSPPLSPSSSPDDFGVVLAAAAAARTRTLSPPPPLSSSSTTLPKSIITTTTNATTAAATIIASTTTPTTKQTRSGGRARNESTKLATSARSLLHPPNATRTNVTSGVIGRRCASYAPTLSELKSTTFEEYVRGEILGVPLPGYEFLYIYEEKEGGREVKRVVPAGQASSIPNHSQEQEQEPLQAVTSKQQQQQHNQNPKTSFAKKQESVRMMLKKKKPRLGNEVVGEVPTTTATMSKDDTKLLCVVDNIITKEDGHDIMDATTATTTTNTTTTTTATTNDAAVAVVVAPSTSATTSSDTETAATDAETATAAARIVDDTKNNAVLLPSSSSSSSSSPSPLSKKTRMDHPSLATTTTHTATSTPTTPTTTTRMMTRSRSNSTTSPRRPNPSSKNSRHLSSSSSSTNNNNNNNIHHHRKKKEEDDTSYRPKRYQMCWYKLRDGIAKVSLPQGFHAKLDTTARGRHWAKGSKLGDMIIPSPIKQAISGIGGVYEYTLLEQPSISVARFRTAADEYRKRQLGSEYDVDDDPSDEACDELARKFWRRLGPTMEPPIYGADMEGSLFGKESHACGWNVNRLESCLCLLRADRVKDGEGSGGGGGGEDDDFHLPGVTSAYLYFGMWASAFAAHTEDMNLLSINYLHAGSPKYWYGIAQEDSKRFESLAHSHFVGRASECSEFLRHKRCLLSPAILRKAGIKFTTCVQRPGDAVITFPGSYHFGFNTGFNIAESTNFAVPEWIPLGMQANICMCHPHSVRIQMDRVKSLLDSYEKDMYYRELKGMAELTYSNWAKQEAKRLKKKQRDSSTTNKQQDLLNNGINGLAVSTLKKINNTSFAVEITNETYTTLLTKKRKKRRQLISTNEWRIAKRVRPSLFVPTTSVICMVECEDEDDSLSSTQNDENEFEFFIGTIVKLVDGFVKVHFVGLTKKDDLWFEQSSDRIFLDCGITDCLSSAVKKNDGKRKKSRE